MPWGIGWHGSWHASGIERSLANAVAEEERSLGSYGEVGFRQVGSSSVHGDGPAR